MSITILRTAATGGATGPTLFLLEGVKVKTGYTANWLGRHGAVPGSNIVMTPTAFMTEKARLEIAETRAKGIRAKGSGRVCGGAAERGVGYFTSPAGAI